MGNHLQFMAPYTPVLLRPGLDMIPQEIADDGLTHEDPAQHHTARFGPYDIAATMEAAVESGQEDDHHRVGLTALHPILPSRTTALYLAEGAANIVYTIKVPYYSADDAVEPFANNRFFLANPSSGGSVFDGQLLRLRKDLPYTASCHIAHADFVKYITPHFDEVDLIGQCLVRLRPSGLIQRLNQELKQWEERIPYSRKPSRLRKRRGVYLADDEYGLLVADQQSTIGATLIEFKPKWLTQSPNAPRYSKRCRTCAKRAYSNAQRTRSGEPLIESFCPLDLLSEDDNLIFRAMKFILKFKTPQSPGGFTKLNQLCQWAKNSNVLHRLRALQHQLDLEGVLGADPQDKKFLTAMTLRDCSVYLKVPDDVTQPITAKLGDMDLKAPEKAEFWQSTEVSLLEEGWYEGVEKEEDKQPLDCNLFPEYWTPHEQRPNLKSKRWSYQVPI